MSIIIPDNKITDIKNAADIVDVISETTSLKKAGKNYIGLCPFHSEKTPSFSVNREKQMFYCFGCGVGGDVFKFIEKQHGIGFSETLKMLAGRYGIDIPVGKTSPDQEKRITERENLLAVNKQAMKFFHNNLSHGFSGKKAAAYLYQRGMTQEIIDVFNLGYAKKEWSALTDFFSRKSVSSKITEKCGLIISKKNKNGFYDRFRDRIVFPIFDINTQVIGFGGRVIGDEMPKYLNSPETPVYNKSKSLYGIHKTKIKCQESRTVHIVEGYFDFLSLYKYGVENVVATLGTSLTAEHIRLLKRYADKAILVYDSDDAGIKAAQRGTAVFMKENMDANIVKLPDGYDPDSYLAKFGAKSFLKIVSEAPSIMSFLINSAISKHGLSIEGKLHIITNLAPTLASIGDNVAKSLYVKEIAERISVDEIIILEKLKKTSANLASNKTNIAHTVKRRENGSKFERKIISMMLQFPEIFSEIIKRDVLAFFEDKALKSIGKLILDYRSLSVNSNARLSEFMNFLKNEEQKRIVVSLAMEEELWNHSDCVKLIVKFIEVSPHYSNNVLTEKIKQAEKNDNGDSLLQLLHEKQKMAVMREKQKMAALKNYNLGG